MPKIRYAFLMLAAAAVPVGCMSIPMAPNANTASVGNPMPLINLGSSNHNALTVAINFKDMANGFKTKSGVQFTMSTITFLAIDLVAHIAGNTATDNYGGAAPLYTLFLRDSTLMGATTATGTTADSNSNGAFAFTNVPQGQYRFRVKASAFAGPGAAVVPGAGQEANKPDLFFTPNNGGWEVSDNFATVTNGQSLVSYSSGGSLTATVALKDGVGDLVSSQITVTNGASIGSIGSIDQ